MVLPAEGTAGVQRAAFDGVTFTIGTEAGNVINVGLQLTKMGVAIAERATFLAYMSDDANGDSLAAVAASGGLAIGTDGTILAEITADRVFLVTSESDGDVDIDITEAAADTWYLVVVLPNGSLAVSGAITFA